MRACIERSLLSGECEASGGEFVFSFAASEDTFRGHFPNYALLPGVFQLEMAKYACERVLGKRLEIETFAKAKFSRPIKPEEHIRLSVTLQPREDAYHAQAAVSVSGQPAGEASLILRLPGEEMMEGDVKAATAH